MSNLDIVSYDAYDKPKSFAYEIDNINQFALTVEIPAIAVWDDTNLRARLQDRLHDDVTNLLKTAEFFSDSNLTQSKSTDHFAIEYQDDVFDFGVYAHQNKIVIIKRGGQLSSFHHWYHAAVPSFRTLVESMLSVMSAELKRSQSITRVGYQFSFIAYDLRQGAKQFRNYEIMNRIITKVPGPDGVIGSVGAKPQEFSRTDYKVGYWDFDESFGRRLLSYTVEAPSNKQFSGLWFYFGYGSETYTDPITGKREWSEPAALLEEYARVYEFMWHRGANGFMRSLLEGITFKTTPTYIP